MSEDNVLLERIKGIVETEKKIDELLRGAKDIIQDLSKEKQTSRTKMEESAGAFKKLLSQVESDLNGQMQYLCNVCVGSAHQGSTFGARESSFLAQTACGNLYKQLEEIHKNVTLPRGGQNDQENESKNMADVETEPVHDFGNYQRLE